MAGPGQQGQMTQENRADEGPAYEKYHGDIY